jgi:DNA (cytosine-5)-methyltransferase 1
MTGRLPTFYEFFAGGGMARAGLGRQWNCVFANDFDVMKAAAYAANWGHDHFVCEDVGKLGAASLPGRADLAWASFPCQDLSLAGDYAGLGHAASAARTRSGTFWPFWALIKDLKKEGRAPRLIVLENVYGALTSRGGWDFAAIGAAFSQTGRPKSGILGRLWTPTPNCPRRRGGNGFGGIPSRRRAGIRR